MIERPIVGNGGFFGALFRGDQPMSAGVDPPFTSIDISHEPTKEGVVQDRRHPKMSPTPRASAKGSSFPTQSRGSEGGRTGK
jgi:hypothetical protein